MDGHAIEVSLSDICSLFWTRLVPLSHQHSDAFMRRPLAFKVLALPKPGGKAEKLELEARKATPAPQVGLKLGSKGVNIMDLCKDYNARCEDYNARTADLQTLVCWIFSLRK
ncbi:hypothetical protein L1987_56374 [Smallanthus sonchifolius]|uniref:Uncharacterized protein n=1 Tax=Smallanthus sonchifolius TaxID=185202 RepID=A0ACB9EDA0_9ASTR|nr:hypothetical protein L1987_56374 [Smallanthus sonchifolius]